MSFLRPSIEQYSLKHSDPERQVLKALSMFTYQKMQVPRMMAGHLQGLVLSMISMMVKPKKALEIGTFTGYSAICLASGLKKDGILHTIDINPEATKTAKKYFIKAGFTHCIKLHTGNAMEVIPSIHGPFDLVYIDADKENYARYYDVIFPRIRKGGWLLADNMFWDGRVLKPFVKQDRETRAITCFARKVLRDKRIDNFILPVRDGIMICRKK